MAGKPMQVGSTGIGGDQHAFAAALNALLGTKLKPISGYPGTQEIMLAVERGELDGIVGYSWGVAKSGNKAQLDDGSLKIILQLALDKHKELPDVPLVFDFVKNPEDRQVLEMIFSRQSMGRPVVAPPGLDPRVVGRAAQGVRRCDARSAIHRRGRKDRAGARVRQRRRGAVDGGAAVQVARQCDQPRAGIFQAN